LLVGQDVVLEGFPGVGAGFVRDGDKLMDDLVGLFPGGRREFNAGFGEDFSEMAEVAGHEVFTLTLTEAV